MPTSPAIVLINVDLPDPEAPIRATISPLATVRPMSLSTGLSRSNDLATWATSIAALLKLVIPCSDAAHQ
jgi:hypothetical protein